MIVDETFAPNDRECGRALSSISGFAFVPGDVLIAPPHATYVGILHGHRLAWIALATRTTSRAADVRASRGTPDRDARLRRSQRRVSPRRSRPSTDAAEARASSRRTRRSLQIAMRGEVAEWQTQPPQKRPRQLMWVRIPPSLPNKTESAQPPHESHLSTELKKASFFFLRTSR